MVVDDFHIVGIAPLPAEADPPLVVYPDAVLPRPGASKGFKAVPRRDPQILQAMRSVEQQQLAPGDPLKRAEPVDSAVMKQPLRILAVEAFDRSLFPPQLFRKA